MGGFRGALGRLFSQGDNPLMWGLPAGTVAGIRIKLGLLLIIYMIAELTMAPLRGGSLVIAAIMLAALLLIVLLHEFGHCFACRFVGGEADEILMWPLGGLAACHPPNTWKAHLITTAGGPLVNVALFPILVLGVLACGGGMAHVVFNPLKMGATLVDFQTAAAGGTTLGLYAKTAVWLLHVTNLMVLLFNVLVPMFPMDGGRLLQALLWRKQGYRASMAFCTTLGLGMAVVLGVLALATEQMTLMGIAIFGGLTCFTEKQRLKFQASGGEMGEPEEPWARSARNQFDDEPTGAASARQRAGDDDADGLSAAQRAAEKARAKAQAQAQADAAEEDRLLAKIAKDGMDSLSRAERRRLEEIAERKRKAKG
ncbi:MAG: hypothetical protein LW650_08575 [Planctomycetaceae bacterium]|jgi:stage IV sporulation protein FB|nr:hypothetical protein [Planctomycetaceae bacterium]